MIMSGSISGSKGGEWTGQLSTWFYLEDDDIDSLRQCGTDLHGITNSEKIQYIGDYTYPTSELSDMANGILIVYHQFVVIETNKRCWSIEKDSEKILLQRSKTKCCVEKYKEGKVRSTTVEIMVEKEERGSMKDLFEFICRVDELKRKYDLISDNCQHSAGRLFSKFEKPSQDTRSPNSTVVLTGVGIAGVLLAYFW